jgi:hypothetical protein
VVQVGELVTANANVSSTSNTHGTSQPSQRRGVIAGNIVGRASISSSFLTPSSSILLFEPCHDAMRRSIRSATDVKLLKSETAVDASFADHEQLGTYNDSLCHSSRHSPQFLIPSRTPCGAFHTTTADFCLDDADLPSTSRRCFIDRYRCFSVSVRPLARGGIFPKILRLSNDIFRGNRTIYAYGYTRSRPGSSASFARREDFSSAHDPALMRGATRESQPWWHGSLYVSKHSSGVESSRTWER